VSDIRVFHCDDSQAFTDLVGFWMADHPDLRLVGAAHDSKGALARLGAAAPDVVLLDTQLPGEAELGVEDVRRAAPGARVIVYSGFPRASAERVGAAGADAYVRKDDDERDLVAAIRALA
jgi:two-component system invasion response regulator UvrY